MSKAAKTVWDKYPSPTKSSSDKDNPYKKPAETSAKRLSGTP